MLVKSKVLWKGVRRVNLDFLVGIKYRKNSHEGKGMYVYINTTMKESETVV